MIKTKEEIRSDLLRLSFEFNSAIKDIFSYLDNERKIDLPNAEDGYKATEVAETIQSIMQEALKADSAPAAETEIQLSIVDVVEPKTEEVKYPPVKNQVMDHFEIFEAWVNSDRIEVKSRHGHNRPDWDLIAKKANDLGIRRRNGGLLDAGHIASAYSKVNEIMQFQKKLKESLAHQPELVGEE